MKNCALLMCLLASSTLLAQNVNFRVMTANLHAFHPYKEPLRFVQDKKGRIKQARADLYFFTQKEILRGHAKRQARMLRLINEARPDIVFLQEVVGGGPEDPKNCQSFYKKKGAYKNTAYELADTLSRGPYPMRAHAHCRGNTGWKTNRETFKNYRVVTQNPYRVVHNFDSNPYPSGLTVEGFATLVRPSIKVQRQELWTLKAGKNLQPFTLQALLLQKGEKWILTLNVHLGHKISNFEQSLAIQVALEKYERRVLQRFKKKIDHVIVAGDFNSRIFNGTTLNSSSEIAQLPFRFFSEGYFDYRQLTKNKFELLERQLRQYNLSEYKPWATIRNPQEAKERIRFSLRRFDQWRKVTKRPMGRNAMLGPCQTPRSQAYGCSLERMIDHIYLYGNTKIINSFILAPKVNYETTSWLSDHPFVFSELVLN